MFSKRGVSKRFHILGPPKNLTVNSSYKTHFFLVCRIFEESKEPVSSKKNLLCSRKVPWVLKVLHRTILDTNKELLCFKSVMVPLCNFQFCAVLTKLAND